MKVSFDTFKAETLPTVEQFKNKAKCVEFDTSQDREVVYAFLRDQLARHTEQHLLDQPLTEQSEMLLGLRPYPRDQ